LERGPWSVRWHAGVSSSAGNRTGDKRCSSGAEEGNVVSSRPKMRGHPTRGLATHSRQETRPSLGPKARARQSWLNAPAGNRRAVTRIHQHRGRANLGNWEEPAPGLVRTDGARLDACRCPSQGGYAVREKRKTVAAVVPSRSRESGSKCSHVVAVAEVGRRRLASNTLVRSAPKRVAVRVNGGLARGHRRR
jgi:hypothetical protein